jgi:prepilin peptidase CpaA
VTPEVWIAGIVGVAAIVDDLRRRQISNWICCSAFASGFVLQVVRHGASGAGTALAGSAAGAAVFLVFYLLGGMGGGDVKLMAGFGAVLGVKRLLEAALWTAGCGGLMALAVILVSAVRSAWERRASGEPEGAGPGRRRVVDSIPYAPAIAAGVWLSLVPRT